MPSFYSPPKALLYPIPPLSSLLSSLAPFIPSHPSPVLSAPPVFSYVLALYPVFTILYVQNILSSPYIYSFFASHLFTNCLSFQSISFLFFLEFLLVFSHQSVLNDL